MAYYSAWPRRICGCYFIRELDVHGSPVREYLPQVQLNIHTTVLSTASRTVLKQEFINPDRGKPLDEVRYTFPIFDGVAVVDFKCLIGERTIFGLVKEKAEARKTYEKAKERGENAALFEQLPDMADIFATSVSNIPSGASIEVTITYIQELKHDAEVDGVRLTIPTHIAPRYGSSPHNSVDVSTVDDSRGISIAVDVSMADGTPIKKIISPSHPIEVSFGTLSTNTTGEDSSVSKASITLALGTVELEKDFILQIVAKDVGVPHAILETHPTLPRQRALMTTLVPKFTLKSQKPEIIFIADRSGSMRNNIPTLISALGVFLKSIPLGCMFNICSFGTHYQFLWSKSMLYGQETLAEAMKYVSEFHADFGGTETLNAVKAAVQGRLEAMPTEIILLTDGDIRAQQNMFDYVEKETKGGDVRVFPIGIGPRVSSALIEGVARAGRGFAQMVALNEKLDAKIVRMLKGALTPHINDYQLKVKYEDGSIDSVAESVRLKLHFEGELMDRGDDLQSTPISLYNPDSEEENPKVSDLEDASVSLPKFRRPNVLQTPHQMPALYPFNRTCVYLLMSPEASAIVPKSVVLKGKSPDGPLELEIPVQLREQPDEMIHQMAARKATQELEEGQGWISAAKTERGELVKDKYPAQYELLQKREAVRLGVEFQVGGKHCSFVAVEANTAEIAERRGRALERTLNKDTAPKTNEEDDDWELVSPHWVPNRLPEPTLLPRGAGSQQKLSNVELPPRLPSTGAIAMGSFSPTTTRSLQMLSKIESPRVPLGKGSERHDVEFARASRLARDRLARVGMSPTTEETSTEEITLLQRLIKRQTFEGSWTIENLPLGDMDITSHEINAIIDKLASENPSDNREKLIEIIATTFVVVYLEKKMADEKDTWELVVGKARDWLEGSSGASVLEGAWKEAKALVK